MQRYLIEREIPGAGNLAPAELSGIAARSNGVIEALGPGIRWVESYVTADRITCVYEADNEAILRQHAARGGFPVTRIAEVRAMLDPSCAGSATTAAKSG
jgi:hypothetical protein